MPRSPRRTLPDGVYHVTVRGVDGCVVFRADDDYRSFLTLLREVANEQRWHVIAFCLMPNHVHLVLACTRRALSDGLRRLNGVHAQRFNRTYGRWGHLWGDRFAARLVSTDEYLTKAVDYVLDNPVRRPRPPPGRLPLERSPPRRDLAGRTHVRRIHFLPAWLPTNWSSTAPASTTSRTSPSACRGTA